MARFSALTDTYERVIDEQISRRTLMKRSVGLALAVPAVAALLAACDDDDDDDEEEVAADETDDTEDEPEPDDDDTEDEEDEEEDIEEDDDEDEEPAADGEGQRGGDLRVTITGDLGTFDTQAVTQSVVGYVVWHIWEHLFTYDEDLNLVPELADTYEVSDDSMNHTITVRESLFHNGDEMTADDVVASLDRWRQIAGTAGRLEDITDSLEAEDERTVQWNLTEPFGILTTVLSRQNSGCVILPAEIMEEIGTGPLTESEHYIGTGPYRFVEHQPDRHILVERFEEYVGREEEASGYSGRKHQYPDAIYFVPVSDEAAAVAGLRAGDYHYVDSLSSDQFGPLDEDSAVTTEMLPAPNWGCFVFNFADGICGGYEGQGLLIRQAILAALDMEEIAIGAYGEGWFRLHPSISFEGLPWESEAGGEYYNQADPERAQELLEEAGYDGEPIEWMTTQEFQDHYDTTTIAVQQLEDAGFNMDLQLFDWATVGERRLATTGWNLMTTSHTFRADPIQLSGIGSATTYGFWSSPDIEDARERFTTESDFDARYEIWEEIQTLYYTEVPRIKVADQRVFHGMSANLRGWTPTVQMQVAHWNHWLDE